MHHPTDWIAHTFVTPVVEHWLEREIAQWVAGWNCVLFNTVERFQPAPLRCIDGVYIVSLNSVLFKHCWF